MYCYCIDKPASAGAITPPLTDRNNQLARLQHLCRIDGKKADNLGDKRDGLLRKHNMLFAGLLLKENRK